MPLPADAILPFDPSSEPPIPITPVTVAGLEDLLADLGPVASVWVESTGFDGAAGSLCLLPGDTGALSRVLIGTGAQAPDVTNPWFLAPVAVGVPEGRYMLDWPIEARRLHEAALLVWAVSHYRFERYKNTSKSVAQLMAPDGVDPHTSLIYGESAALVRDLINTPAEDMGPAELEDAAAALAEEFGGTIATIVGDDLLHENFPSIHAVGRAAVEARAPRLIELGWTHADANEDTRHVILVGKGVCFDSGGLNIKPDAGMRLMKKDMGGAAHALGLARLIMASGLKLKLTVLISAVENAVSAGAFRPGDILATREGLSVEVGHTDAEGRLVLSDALTYAGEKNPDLLVDFATLTGAARVALGGDLPATFVNEDALWDTLNEAAADVSDPLWRLPLWAPYRDSLKSPIADLSNVSDGPLAGSITAALFLEHFVPDGVPWIHFDLFGWNPRARPGRPVGAATQAIFATFAAIRQRFMV